MSSVFSLTFGYLSNRYYSKVRASHSIDVAQFQSPVQGQKGARRAVFLVLRCHIFKSALSELARAVLGMLGGGRSNRA